MIEKLIFGRHIDIKVQDIWYRIPWIVLVDEVVSIYEDRDINTPIEIVNKARTICDGKVITTKDIFKIKEVILHLFNDHKMIAYKLYNLTQDDEGPIRADDISTR